jgi:adenylylsulfate kinase
MDETRTPPKVLWLIGLSGAGKSTIGDALIERLTVEGVKAARLDGDDLRTGLNADLGFSAEDRSENLRRAAHVAKLFTKLGNVTICSFITPLRADRDTVRAILGVQYVEVYVSTCLQVCESRDPKGLYKKARSGQIKEFTGISAAFEEPVEPHVTIDTVALSVEQAVDLLAKYLSEPS